MELGSLLTPKVCKLLLFSSLPILLGELADWGLTLKIWMILHSCSLGHGQPWGGGLPVTVATAPLTPVFPNFLPSPNSYPHSFALSPVTPFLLQAMLPFFLFFGRALSPPLYSLSSSSLSIHPGSPPPLAFSPLALFLPQTTTATPFLLVSSSFAFFLPTYFLFSFQNAMEPGPFSPLLSLFSSPPISSYPSRPTLHCRLILLARAGHSTAWGGSLPQRFSHTLAFIWDAQQFVSLEGKCISYQFKKETTFIQTRCPHSSSKSVEIVMGNSSN